MIGYEYFCLDCPCDGIILYSISEEPNTRQKIKFGRVREQTDRAEQRSLYTRTRKKLCLSPLKERCLSI